MDFTDEKDYIMRIIKEMVRVLFSLVFGKKYVSVEIEKENKITLSQFDLKEVIRQTIFSVSDNENNKLMTGELLSIENNKMTVTSLDGHRISVRNIELQESYPKMEVIVPGKTLSEVSKILPGEPKDTINLYLTDKHILFEFGETKVVSRLLAVSNTHLRAHET